MNEEIKLYDEIKNELNNFDIDYDEFKFGYSNKLNCKRLI